MEPGSAAPETAELVRAGGVHVPALLRRIEERLREDAAVHAGDLAEHGGATIAAVGDRVVIVADRRVGVSTEVDPVDTVMHTTTVPGTAVAPLTPVTRDGLELRGRNPVVGGGPAGAYVTWYDEAGIASRGAPLDVTGAVAAGRVTPVWLRAQPVAARPQAPPFHCLLRVPRHFDRDSDCLLNPLIAAADQYSRLMPGAFAWPNQPVRCPSRSS